MREALTIASFVAGLIPMAIFILYYGLKTRWYETITGIVMFLMGLATTVSYSVSVLTLTLPGYFREEQGEWIRIGIRFALAGVAWSLLWLLVWAQKTGERERKLRRQKEAQK
jgi:hypothetical protein